MTTHHIRLGLPSEAQLKNYRIWDSYFTPAFSHPGKDGLSTLKAEINRAQPAVRKAQFEKLCYFPHVGVGTTTDSTLEKLLQTNPDVISMPMRLWPGQFIGMIQVNANQLEASIDAVRRWIHDGPMVGVYFPGGGPGAVPCSHKNCERLTQKVIDVGGVVMQHTWFRTGGKASSGASTPAELASLAKKFPEHQFVCAHAGGEWEKGIRAVRNSPNVLVETSGFDATAGFIDMAVREIGAERIIFGSHLPSRSLGTELSKVTAADISEAAKKQILGANFRRLLNLE